MGTRLISIGHGIGKSLAVLFLLAIIGSAFMIEGCKKIEKVMVVTTGTVSNILSNSADVSGNIIDLGSGAMQFGHCYGKSPNVTINGTKTQLGTPSARGGFTSQLSDLEPGTRYYVKAYVSDSKLTIYGDEISFTTLAAVPSAPSGLTATAVSSSRIDLSWTDNSNNEAGFKLERSPDGITGWNEIASLPANTTTYSNTGLTSSTTYFYRARSFNPAGNSDYSGTSSASTQTGLPSAPTGLVASAVSSSQIDLQWTDNSSNETGFKLERSLDGTTGWNEISILSSNTTTYSNTGLSVFTTYYYRVRSFNSGGNSDYSGVANATTLPAPPTAPTGLNATAISSSQIDLQWSDNSTNETGFKLERSPDGVTGWNEIASLAANSTVYSNTGLSASTTYFYRVRSMNSGGYSDYSATSSATTHSILPAAPSGLIASAISSSQIDLQWTDNSNNETGFKVERSNTGSSGWSEIASLPANSTSYSNTGLLVNSTLYYRVSSINLSGVSQVSNTASAITPYEASYSSTNPTIDGQVITTEWASALKYPVTFIRPDGNATKPAELYFQHDRTWLYIGIKTEVQTGYDVYLTIMIDGNSDHILAGKSTEPRTDINISSPSPTGWNGYVRYDYLDGVGVFPTTAPVGTSRASHGSTIVTYEFKIKISELDLANGESCGFYMYNYSYPIPGVTLVYDYELQNHGYEFPEKLVISNPSKWAHLKLR